MGDPAGAAPGMEAPGGMDPSMGMHGKGPGGGEGQLHIGADMLPEGMKLNKGDIVEFKVTGDQDADGDWPIEYNYGEGGKEGEGKGMEEEAPTESWEEGLMKHMSPRSGGEEAQGGGGGY